MSEQLTAIFGEPFFGTSISTDAVLKAKDGFSLVISLTAVCIPEIRDLAEGCMDGENGKAVNRASENILKDGERFTFTIA